MKIRSFLKLVRIHTSCLTQGGVILATILAGERRIPILIAYALWAILFHAVGFVDNNIEDYEHDRKDPAKKHFPLVTGEVSLRQAKTFSYTGMLIAFLLGFFMAEFRLLPIAFLMLTFTFGRLYNALSKKSIFSPVYISGSFTSLVLFAYYSRYGGCDFNPLIALFTMYTFFLMFWQIAWEGYIKDIKSDKVNLLRVIGCKVQNGTFKPSTIGKIFGWGFRLPTIIIGLAILYVTGEELFVWLGFTALSASVLYSSNKLVKKRRYDHSETVMYCAITEVLVYFSIVIALHGVLGILTTLTLIFYPIIWFITLNRLTWKTWITPRV